MFSAPLPFGAAAGVEQPPSFLRLLVRIKTRPYCWKTEVARGNRKDLIMRKDNLMGDGVVVVIAVFLRDKALNKLDGK